MQVAPSIVQIFASLIGYLSARGMDEMISKWVAYFMIAWEKVATRKALDEYLKTKEEMIQAMPEKWKEWESWRDSIKTKSGA